MGFNKPNRLFNPHIVFCLLNEPVFIHFFLRPHGFWIRLTEYSGKCHPDIAHVLGNILLVVTFLIPVSAVFFGWLLLDERLGKDAFTGMGMIVIGLMVLDGRVMKRSLQKRNGINNRDSFLKDLDSMHGLI